MFGQLSNDLTSHILSFLPRADRGMCRFVCHKWRRLIIPFEDMSGPLTCYDYVHDEKLLRWVYTKGCPFSDLTFSRAVSIAPLSVLDYLRQVGCPITTYLGPCEKRDDLFSFIEWAYNHSLLAVPFPEQLYIAAALQGRIGIMGWLEEHNTCSFYQYVDCTRLIRAVPFGTSSHRFSMLDWIVGPSIERAKIAIDEAAAYTDYTTFKEIHARFHQPLDGNTLQRACQGGSLEIIQYLLSLGLQLESRHMTSLACNAKFDILKWVLSQGAPFDDQVFNHIFASGTSGIVSLLNWLETNGYFARLSMTQKEFSQIFTDLYRSCLMAYYPEAHELIDWMVERRYPWPEELDFEIYSVDHIKHAHSRGYQLCTLLYYTAADQKSLDFAEWLYDKGIQPTDACIQYAIDHHNIPFLQWLLLHGCTYPDNLHWGTSFSVMKWARAHGYTGQFTYDNDIAYIRQWIEQGCPTA